MLGTAEILELEPHFLKNANSSLGKKSHLSYSQSLASWAVTKGEGWGSSWDIQWHPAGKRASPSGQAASDFTLGKRGEPAVQGTWADSQVVRRNRLPGDRHCLDKAANAPTSFVLILGVPAQVEVTQAQVDSHGKNLDGPWRKGQVIRDTREQSTDGWGAAALPPTDRPSASPGTTVSSHLDAQKLHSGN